MTDNPRSSAEIVPINNGRDASGRFTTGAGNVGRPVGSRNKISNEALASVKSMKDEAIEQLREKLIAGEFAAILFVLERVLPKGRTIELSDATPEAISNALVSGELTTVEAKDVATALAKLSEISELQQLRERLEALEKAARDVTS